MTSTKPSEMHFVLHRKKKQKPENIFKNTIIMASKVLQTN